MITDVFFDLDNTLWDFRANSKSALEELFNRRKLQEKYGLDFPTFYKKYYFHNERLWEDLRDGRIDATFLKKERFRVTFHEIGIENEAEIRYFYENYLPTITHYNQLVKGALDLIFYLKPKYNLHVLTNGFLEVTHRKINESELKGHFQTITSAEEIEKRKPNPEIFNWALKKADTTPDNSCYIGDDWIADGLGAKAIGMYSIFYDALEEGKYENGISTVNQLKEIMELL